MTLYYLERAPGGRLRRVDLAERLGLTASGVTRSLLPLEKNWAWYHDSLTRGMHEWATQHSQIRGASSWAMQLRRSALLHKMQPNGLHQNRSRRHQHYSGDWQG